MPTRASFADLRARWHEPGPTWTLIPHASDADRAAVRVLIDEWQAEGAFADGVVWLDAAAPHPWLRTPWPLGLAQAIAAADAVEPAAAAWCRDAQALIVVEGGEAPLPGLAPGEMRAGHVLWLPDGDVVAAGWARLAAASDADPARPSFDPADAPWALVVFRGAFTPRAARAVAGDLDLPSLAERGWLTRAAGGTWRLHRSARAFLEAFAPDGVRAAALEAWSKQGWVEEREAHALVRPDVTFEDAAALWFTWWRAGWLDRYVRQASAFNAWGRARAEQARVRFWHQAFLDHADGRDAAAVGWLAIAISRCESDLGQGRSAAARAWIERGLAALPESDPRRATALLQAASVAFAGGDPTAAARAAQQAVAFGETQALPAINRAPALADLAFYQLLSGDASGAEAPLQAAIDILRSHGAGLTLLNVLNTLAMLMIALDRPIEAVAASAEAIERAELERHVDAMPFVLHTHAVALLAVGRVAEAHDCALRALHALIPAAHAGLAPLLTLSYERVRVRLGGAEVERAFSAAREASGGGSSVAYAALLVGEALAAAGERPQAAALLDHLLAVDPEAHVRALARVARRALGATDAAPRAAPDLSDHAALYAAHLTHLART
jgi:tetratricopeptide (TPR) repeat protein